MLIKHEKSKFTQRLSDIFKWSKDKSPSTSKEHIDTILDAEYAALLHEIDGLTQKNQSCTVSFKNENFSKPALSSEEVSTLIKNHSSEVIQKYVKNHDKSKKYKNLTPEEFLTYLTEIIVTKCNNNECNCGRHKVTINRDEVQQENRDVVKETQPGKFGYDAQYQDVLRESLGSNNGNESIRDKRGSEVPTGSIRSTPVSAGKNNGSKLVAESIRNKNASNFSGSKKNGSVFRDSFDRTSARSPIIENEDGSNRYRPSFDENQAYPNGYRSSFDQGRASVNEEKDNINEKRRSSFRESRRSSIKENRTSVDETRRNLNQENNGTFERKGCNHKLCTCKPFQATKEIGTERAKLSKSENIQADAGSTRLSKDKSAIIDDQTLNNGFQRISLEPVPVIHAKPQLENEAIQTSDCTIHPNCYCCQKFATVDVVAEKKDDGTKVPTKDQDTAMLPDTAVQTSRLCVPFKYEQMMQEPNTRYEFGKCPLEKKDCMCDAYDAKMAVERGWVLPSSEICMQTGKKSKKPRTFKSDTDVRSISSIEPSTKNKKMQFQAEKTPKNPKEDTILLTESMISTDFDDKKKKPSKRKPRKSITSSDESEVVIDKKAAKNNKKAEDAKKKKKEGETKKAKKEKEKKGAEKKKAKEKEKKKKDKNGKDKKDKKKVKDDDYEEEDNENVKVITYPTCASDSSLNIVMERRQRRSSKQSKYDDTSDSDASTAKKKPKKDKEKPKKEKRSSKQEKDVCEDEEEVVGCFGKKKKRPRQNCEVWCDAECNRAIQTKLPIIANKKDQANPAEESSIRNASKKRGSVSSVSSDVSARKRTKSGSMVMCGKCGKEKKGCCQGCRNTIVVQPGSSRNLQDSNSLRMLIKMQAKDTNRRFDDVMSELNYQKTEIQRLNGMYQVMLQENRTSNHDVTRNETTTNNRRNNNVKKPNCCPCDDNRKRFGPEGTTVAINRCEVCHFDIARGQFPNLVRETFSRETYSGCRCEDCDSDKLRKDMINQSRQHLQRKPFSFSNDDYCRRVFCEKPPDDDDFFKYPDCGVKRRQTSSQKLADWERLGTQMPDIDKNKQIQRYHRDRERKVRPKTRIPFGETSIADTNDIDERNMPLYQDMRGNKLPPDERGRFGESPQRYMTETRDAPTNAIRPKYNETESMEILLDTESEPFPEKSNDSCRDRFYTWLKSAWAKAEECQRTQREINKQKSATRRSKIKSGLIKMLRSLVKTNIAKTKEQD